MTVKILFLGFSIALLLSCQAGGGGSERAPASTNNSNGQTPDSETLKPEDKGTVVSCRNTVGSLTGNSKCWTKMLDTPEYQKCRAAGKIYNRIKKVCADTIDLNRVEDSSGIADSQIKSAHEKILQVLPKAYLTMDQCGLYKVNGQSYAFAYVMGQQYFEEIPAENKPGTYKVQVRLICYGPTANSGICSHASLKVSDAAPLEEGNLGSCD